MENTYKVDYSGDQFTPTCLAMAVPGSSTLACLAKVLLP
jgi:hypothetical protein